jgi:ATP-binding cassette subfamily B protein
MGFFSGLGTEAYDRTYRDRDLIRRMLGYFLRYRGRLLGVILGLAFIAISGALTPILIAQGMDLMTAPDGADLILLLSAILLFMGISTWFANWFRRRALGRAVADVMADLRRDAFDASMSHDLSFYDRFASGRVVSRITSDTQEFAQVVVLSTDLTQQLTQALLLIVVLAGINLQLTLWLLAIMPVVFAVAIGFRRLARFVTRRGFRAMANVNSAIKEAVTGIAVAKNFRQENTIFEEFDQVNRVSFNINVRRGLVLSTIFPTLEVVAGGAVALLLYLGARSTAAGEISYGAWFLFISSLARFWFPILNLSAFWTQLQNGLSAAERVFALIDTEPAVVQTGADIIAELEGEIRFENVDFQYLPGEAVLNKFNLYIPAGQSVALVGHTGAGKSSIAKLITRFYEFQGGHISIDGLDLRDLDLVAYRRQLGIVSQDPFLFAGSAVENICYSVPDITREGIGAMAARIGGGEWLETLPDGLDTEVGERGANLSMGQRQLVALMRVLVQRPAIFILDEATASVDPFTEAQIQEALTLILSESTSIVIAHRLSTVLSADRILVVRDGDIIEEGDHAALMAARGHYAELYTTYFRHQSLEYVDSIRREALRE